MSPQTCADDGHRGVFVAIDLATGATVANLTGNWGGGSPASDLNRVDSDRTEYPLPAGIVAIKGQAGYRTHLSLYASPSTLTPLLPAAPAVSEIEGRILGYFRSYTPAYRKEYLARIPGAAAVIDGLVAAGYLKRNAAGATQITTAGKNAASKV